MTDPSPILTQTRGAALWLTINREDRRNAMNKAVLAGLESALRDAANNKKIRAIVLTGAGRKAFCAGADLSGGTSTFTLGLEEPQTDFGKLARLVRDSQIPLIARINGDCIAGGMALMSLADLAIAADHARFGLPEAKVGVFPMQVLVYLRKMVPPRIANELCLTGEFINATRAREIGIANQVVPYENLDEAVEQLTSKLTAMSPMALRRGKYAIAAMESMSFAEALAFAEQLIAITSLTPDAAEGLSAFNEKRPPAWKETES